MDYTARVEVRLKPGYSDPEGEATERSLRELRYPVGRVEVSKVYEIRIESDSIEEAGRIVDEMCRRLLTNPVKDDYQYRIEQSR